MGKDFYIIAMFLSTRDDITAVLARRSKKLEDKF